MPLTIYGDIKSRVHRNASLRANVLENLELPPGIEPGSLEYASQYAMENFNEGHDI